MKKIALTLTMALTSLLMFADDDYFRFVRSVDQYSHGYANNQVVVLYQNHYGIPQSTLIQLYNDYGNSWGNVVLGLELSHFLGLPISDVFGYYREGNGWGVTAQRYGIKPGSAEFHRMKSIMSNKNNYWRGVYRDYKRDRDPRISRRNRIVFNDGMIIYNPSGKEMKKINKQIEKRNKEIYKQQRKNEKEWEKRNKKIRKEQKKQRKRYEKIFGKVW